MKSAVCTFIWGAWVGLVLCTTPAFAQYVVIQHIWGRPGTAPGQIGTSRSMAVAPDNTVCIADADKGRIQRFTTTGTYLGAIGGPGTGAGQFDGVIHIAIAPTGRIYTVTDSGRLQWFASDGQYEQSPSASGLSGLLGLALDPALDRLYASITFFINEVGVTGQYLGNIDWAPAGTGIGAQMCVGHDSRLYVLGGGSTNVQVFEPNGSPVRTFRVAESGDVAIDSNDIVYVAGLSGVHVYSSAGDALGFASAGTLQSLGGACIGPNQELYVLDWLAGKVYVWATQTSVTPTQRTSWGQLKSRFH